MCCYGPLAHSTADAALLLDAIRGNVPADLHRPAPPAEPFAAAAAREPERLRVAISFATPPAVSGKVHSEHRAAVEAFGEQLAEPGLQRRLGRIFEHCDVVLTPTTAMPPPPRIGALPVAATG